MALRLVGAKQLSEQYIFIQENAFENVVCEMVVVLSQPQCVKRGMIVTTCDAAVPRICFFFLFSPPKNCHVKG